MADPQITWDPPAQAGSPASGAPQIKWDDEPKKQPSQPSVWQTLTQPTAKTDSEYLGYRGAPGVAGATIHGLNKVAEGTQGALKGIWDDVSSGHVPLIHSAREGIVNTAKALPQIPGAIHDINQSPDPLGVYANVAEDTAGQGAGQALVGAAAENLPKVVDAVPRIAKGGVRLGARAIETAANQKLVPLKPLLNINTPADAAESLHFKVPGRDVGIAKPNQPVYPGAHLPLAPDPGVFHGPEAPAPELANSRSLATAPTPIARPAAQTGEALGRIPVGESTEAAAASTPTSPSKIAKPSSSATANLEKQLNDSLGGRPLEPGVSLRNQGIAKPSATTSLPEGFTPVKSSAVKGYKYDPATREFESITSSGQHYIHGDVTPEQVQAFAEAESKGKAWNEIRQGGTPVGKVVGGKRIARVPPKDLRSFDPIGETASPVIGESNAKPINSRIAAPSSSTPGRDLTPLLEKSLEKAKGAAAASGDVPTSADPGEIAKRWGVDEHSLAETREQTRGMNPKQYEEYIQKLTDRYKRGEKVEPLLETRDEENNIISVDGRARAIAAQRAGVDRVPIIVRRMPKGAAKASTR